MYKAYYELKQAPFRSDINSKALYMSPMLSETLSRLEYTANNQLFAVVTADVGCGKSTSIRRFTDDL